MLNQAALPFCLSIVNNAHLVYNVEDDFVFAGRPSRSWCTMGKWLVSLTWQTLGMASLQETGHRPTSMHGQP
jgi:hypothetical protein